MAQQPPISYRATAAELQQLSQLARSLGCSRHFLLRSAVAQFLESQKINQTATNSLVNEKYSDHYRQAVINN